MYIGTNKKVIWRGFKSHAIVRFDFQMKKKGRKFWLVHKCEEELFFLDGEKGKGGEGRGIKKKYIKSLILQNTIQFFKHFFIVR